MLTDELRCDNTTSFTCLFHEIQVARKWTDDKAEPCEFVAHRFANKFWFQQGLQQRNKWTVKDMNDIFLKFLIHLFLERDYMEDHWVWLIVS